MANVGKDCAQINASVPKELHAFLRSHALADGRTLTAVTREAIGKWARDKGYKGPLAPKKDKVTPWTTRAAKARKEQEAAPEDLTGICRGKDCGMRSTLDADGLCPWCRAIKADAEEPKPRSAVPEANQRAIVAAYRGGMSMPGIARESGYSQTAIFSVLKSWPGVISRGRGRPTSLPPTGLYRKHMEAMKGKSDV